MKILLATLIFAALPVVALAADAPPDNATLYQIIQAQQEAIDRLNASASTSATHIGGYGELHYADLDSGRELDFHRFVLFVSHDFSTTTRLFTELELEHAVASSEDEGEVELEQAYVQFDLGKDLRLNSGLFLMPIGLINETHEPTTFYGVERNPIETTIIPSTWREGGVSLNGHSGGFGYDLGVTSGLKLDATLDIEESKQEAMHASMNSPAVVARVKYTGLPGFEWAASGLVQNDMAQGELVNVGRGTLLETHLRYNHGPLTLTALWAGWKLDGALAAALHKDRQSGYYVESSWRYNPHWGFFARYSDWDTGGFGLTQKTQTTIGFNVWPTDGVVLKFDVQDQGKAANDTGFHLGLGFQF